MTTATPPSQTNPAAPALTGTGREHDVAGMFNRIAKRYDVLNDCISMGMHRGWKRAAVKALNLQPGTQVLDVATGTGDLVQYLLPTVGPNGHVTGVDISEEMLNVARQRFGQHTNTSFILGSAMALPLVDNTMDGAIISFGLRNVDNVPQVLAELARVVKPGGTIVSLDTAPDPWLPGFWWYFNLVMPTVGKLISGDNAAYKYLAQSTKAFVTPKQLQAMFADAGLTNVAAKRLAFGSVAVIAGQK